MAVIASFDTQHKVMLIMFSGVLPDRILLDTYANIAQWMEANGQCSIVFDFSAVTSLEISSAGVRNLARRPPLISNDLLRIVVAPDDLSYGMARMFAMLGSETRDMVHIVRDRQSVYRVLGVESLECMPVELPPYFGPKAGFPIQP